MAAKPVCLVCHQEMEPGFLIDRGHGPSTNLPRWCPGEPKASFWWGEVKRSQLEAGFKMVAYRCPKCEALRLYAPSSDSQH